MAEMNKKASELNPDFREKIEDALMKERDQAFEEIFKLDANLTNNNFLVNAGDAAATLAFIGAKTGTAVAVWPLMFSTIGLIATGLEIRALLYYFGECHGDAVRRREEFASDKITVRECLPTNNTGKFYSRMNHWSGWVSQGSFIIGSLIGIFQLYNYVG